VTAAGSPAGPAPWAASNSGTPAAKARRLTPSARRAGLAARIGALLGAGLALGACGRSPEPVRPAAPYVDPGFAEAGDYRLHYALTPTRDLPSAIAGSYGIEPRSNLALLSLVIVPRRPGAAAPADAHAIEATRVELTGQRTALALSRHDDAGAPTWLATVELRHRLPVTIEIRARATAESPEIVARLTREFRLE
jgi:Domain of unknown function (DUF4426)